MTDQPRLTRAEVAEVLMLVARHDRRNLGGTDAEKARMLDEWSKMIGHNRLDDALNAVLHHNSTSTEYLKPAHINDIAKGWREERAREAQHAALQAPNAPRKAIKPANFDALAAAWNDPDEYARQEDIANAELMESGRSPVFDTFLALPPIGSGKVGPYGGAR